MAIIDGNLPLTPDEMERVFEHPIHNRRSNKGCGISSTVLISIALSLLLGACEGSKTDGMIKATERAVDDYNNGDSSSLIMLIVGVLVLGALWLLGKWIDSKK